MHHKPIIYNKPTRCNSGSIVFINNYRYAPHVLDAICAQCATDLEHLYRIYSIPTHDKHQWLLLQFIVLLMMDAKGIRNMWSIPAVVNKHNTARVASCWFIIYYSVANYLKMWRLPENRNFIRTATKCREYFLCASYNLLHRGMRSVKRRLHIESMLEMQVRGPVCYSALRL